MEKHEEEKIKIGYQGIEGSNAFKCAQTMAKHSGLRHYELLPLVFSQTVVNALTTGEIDFGVMAIKNSIAGSVQETQEAMKDVPLESVLSEKIAVRHAAFKKNKKIRNPSIDLVISHEQALLQCHESIKKLFPNATFQTIEDTAIGAKDLAEGKYGIRTAVICSSSAGGKYKLWMEKAQIQDRKDNMTEFQMFKRPNP
jgi:prephenate dehydratase